MKKHEEIKKLILDFENHKTSLKTILPIINGIGNKKIDEYDLINYWKHTSLDEFINYILAKSIRKWDEIEDEDSLLLIKGIIDNLIDDQIIDRNIEALEKRYRKQTGSISDWIFMEDISDPLKILEKLKKQDDILL
ncbi:hypothetical protein [Tenacibaculum soleae]|uniref:hypothetical protein n=1 Tax=Tenacibaculum soleae TaxID=447689 RepID=UPI0023017958|nr:hypothetical protein [Tenacibaculum soleae]